MRLYVVLFAFGAWLLQQQAVLPEMRYAALIMIAAPALFLARSRRSALAHLGRAGLAMASCAAGFYWAAALAHVRVADALRGEWEGRDIELIGVVASLPQPYERSVRFDFDVERVLTPDAHVPSRISLAWWSGAPRSPAAALPQVSAGERWRYTVRLKRPHGGANPHAFDYEWWLLERGVRATGYVRSNGSAERIATIVHRPQYWIEAARETLRARILAGLQDASYAGVIAALVMGDQRAIPIMQWQVFTRTGVNHLMSISGLHITMLAGLAYAVAAFAWRRSAKLVLMLPAQKAAALAGALAALLYTLLAGFAVPAQRTLYMIVVVTAALWAGASASASVVLAAALFVVVALDPWTVIAAGFWLSFGAVGAILLVVVNRIAKPNWIAGWARTQCAVTIALLPLLLALFQQISLVSPLANAFAIPVVSLIVVPLAIGGSVLPFDAVLQLAHAVMSVCMAALEWMSALPHAVWEQHAPVAWALAVAAAGVLWLIVPRGVPARWLGAVACLPLFLVLPARPPVGELRLSVLDVGQGLAVVMQTARHALLYDAGPAFGPLADSGNRVIAPYLRALGVRKLDGLIVSHDDEDHAGGVLSILQALPVEWFASSLEEMDPVPLLAERALRCAAGQTWEWDGVVFQVVHPTRADYDVRGTSNDRSCVLRVSAPGGSVLIPADASRRVEEALLLRGEPIASDVLIAGHHGSRTSSTDAFVAAVAPRHVVFSVGYRNRFGHPHPDVLERYRERDAALSRTDRDGAVLIDIAADRPIRVERYRDIRRRYWSDAPVDTRSSR